jgi:hypothetical protein
MQRSFDTANQLALCYLSWIDNHAFQLHSPQQKRHWQPDRNDPPATPSPSTTGGPQTDSAFNITESKQDQRIEHQSASMSLLRGMQNSAPDIACDEKNHEPKGHIRPFGCANCL